MRHPKLSRRRSHVRGVGVLVIALGLVGSGVTPAAANHDPSGHQAHVGIVGDGYQGNPCSTYHSFDGTYVFDDGSVTVGTSTYNGPIVLHYKESLTNSNSWHEFADGSYASGTGCQTVAQGGVGPGVDWIPGFTMEITGDNNSGDELTCTDATAEYRRGRDLTLNVADPEHQNFRSNGGDVSCTVTPNGAGSTSATGSVASTQILFACTSPITPATCSTKGGSFSFDDSASGGGSGTAPAPDEDELVGGMEFVAESPADYPEDPEVSEPELVRVAAPASTATPTSTALKSCRSVTYRGSSGAIYVQYDAGTGLQWGIYMYDPSEDSGRWSVYVYVDGRKKDQKTQNYPPHGSLRSADVPSGSVFTVKAMLTTVRSYLFFTVYRQYRNVPNACVIP